MIRLSKSENNVYQLTNNSFILNNNNDNAYYDYKSRISPAINNAISTIRNSAAEENVIALAQILLDEITTIISDAQSQIDTFTNPTIPTRASPPFTK